MKQSPGRIAISTVPCVHLGRIFNHLEHLQRKVEHILPRIHLSTNSSVEGEADVEADVLKDCFDSADPVGLEFQIVSHGAEHCM